MNQQNQDQSHKNVSQKTGEGSRQQDQTHAGREQQGGRQQDMQQDMQQDKQQDIQQGGNRSPQKGGQQGSDDSGSSHR